MYDPGTPTSHYVGHNTSDYNRGSVCVCLYVWMLRAILLPTLLCVCEKWTLYQRHARKLNHVHTTGLRRLLNIKWQDKIPDTEVLAQAGLSSIHTIMIQSQVRWAGRVARVPDHWLPKRLLYGELQEGERSQGGQKERF